MHSIARQKPATGDCDTAEYFLKSSNGASQSRPLRAQGQTPRRDRVPLQSANTARVFRVIRAYMIDRKHRGATMGENCQRLK